LDPGTALQPHQSDWPATCRSRSR